MRLRQAHAIIEAAAALEAAGLDFELGPFDYDRYGTAPSITDDHMTGFTEFNDPDKPGRNARIYNIDLTPGPDDHRVTVHLKFGFGDDGRVLLHEAFDVSQTSNGDDESGFRGLVGARIAELAARAVREHEKPYVAAYEERARRSDD